MSVVRQSSSLNSSLTSSQFDSNEDMNTVKVKNYIKGLLKSRIFLGRYIERRLIDQRVGYRDIVLLSAAEIELKKDLLEAQHKLRTLYHNIHWIGITDTDVLGYNSPGVCLWTEIDNQPFGPFWFQIRSVKFRDEEIIVILKCLRHITDAFVEIEPMLTGTMKKNKDCSESNVDNTALSLNKTYNEIVGNLRNVLSISNVKEFITFLFAFVIAIFTGSTAFVNFLGNFILALIREMSILIKNSTPMFLGFLDFLSKIVGGFYILLAMFFKPNNTVNPSNKRIITYHDPPRRSSNHYDSRFID